MIVFKTCGEILFFFPKIENFFLKVRFSFWEKILNIWRNGQNFLKIFSSVDYYTRSDSSESNSVTYARYPYVILNNIGA